MVEKKNPTDMLKTPRVPIGRSFELEFSAAKRPEWCRIYTCIKILEGDAKSTNDSIWAITPSCILRAASRFNICHIFRKKFQMWLNEGLPR